MNWDIYHEFLRAAPGDSFRDNIRPGIDPLRYDETKGVSLYSNSPNDLQGNWYQPGTPVTALDAAVVYDGLMIKSENGWAVAHNTNHAVILNSIVDGSYNGTIDTTTVGEVIDSLVIVRGRVGVFGKYGVGITGSTIICDSNVPNTMGVIRHIAGGLGNFPWGNTEGGPPFYNNLILISF